jgi:hypothetical protein
MHHTDTPQDDTAQAARVLALISAVMIGAIIAGLYGLSVGIQWIHRAF